MAVAGKRPLIPRMAHCQHARENPQRKYLATHIGCASYDPLACTLTRRTAMYRERDAEASF
jgi:hypothetical protein